jgi:hypothetical protein
MRLRGNRWDRLGRAIPANGKLAALGEDYSARDTLDLGLVDVARGRRWVWSFSHGRWRRSAALAGIGGGPMPGGPVRLGARVYLPVIDTSREPWRFLVHVLADRKWSPVGRPLNRTAGNAQGVLRINDNAVWASWQEHQPRRDGLFDTRLYVQRVARRSGGARRVWDGASIGPGSIETVAGAEGQSVLYMPSSDGRRGLTVRVGRLDAP